MGSHKIKIASANFFIQDKDRMTMKNTQEKTNEYGKAQTDHKLTFLFPY